MKHLYLRASLLMLTFLSFAQMGISQVTGNGRPQIDHERTELCWKTTTGVDSSIVKYDYFRQGRTGVYIASSVYYNLEGDTITVADGTLSGGFCSADITSKTLTPIFRPMCDYDVVTDSFFTFIRVFLVDVDPAGNTVSTSVGVDMDYQANPYTVIGQEGIGTCAREDSLTQIIDEEFLQNCWVDRQTDGTEIQFWRIWYMHDSTTVDVDENLQAYTITGVAKSCGADKVVARERLCDVEMRDAELTYQGVVIDSQKIEFTRNSSIFNYLPIVNATIDCGQGAIHSARLLLQCDCDYSDVPDGQYFPQIVADLKNYGRVVEDTKITVLNGKITLIENAIVPQNFTIGFSPISVKYNVQSFFRIYKQDRSFEDVDLDNNPYVLTGQVAENCSNEERFTQEYTPTTRPSLSINDEDCEVQRKSTRTLYETSQVITIAGGTYHSISIEPVTDGVFVSVDGGTSNEEGIYTIIGDKSPDDCKYHEATYEIDLTQFAGAAVFISVGY